MVIITSSSFIIIKYHEKSYKLPVADAVASQCLFIAATW